MTIRRIDCALLLVFLTSCLVHPAIPGSERAALIALYNATGGDSWTSGSGWKTPPLNADGFAMPGTEGTWYGITVTGDHVTRIVMHSNNLVGPLPPQLEDLSSLEVLDLLENRIDGSIPAELGGLANLTNLDLGYNSVTGSIPAELGNLTSLERLFLYDNLLGGTIPGALGNLTALTELRLDYNKFTGSIPAALGSLSNLVRLGLGHNQLEGPIPAGLGDLSALETLKLESNMLAGPVPGDITGLTSLVGMNMDYNALFARDPAVIAFLDAKDPDWKSTQTVAPQNVAAAAMTGTTVQVTWDAITYTGDEGGYRVFYATSSGDPYTYFGQTADKNSTSMLVTGLAPATPYFFVVRTRTDPHRYQSNTVDSEYSAEATAVTLETVSGGSFVHDGVWENGASSGLHGWYSGDFTGDGMTDLLSVTLRHNKVFESNGTQFNKLGSWTTAHSGLYGWFPGDFSGDGRTDLLRCAEGDRTQVFLSSGAAFVKDYIWADVDPGREGYSIGDFNGDGYDDMLVVAGVQAIMNRVYLNNGAAFEDAALWLSSDSGADGWYTGDFNGDGMTDLARVITDQGTQVFLSSGTAFIDDGIWTPGLPQSNGWYVGDFNHDGVDDLLRGSDGVSGVEVFLSTGSAFTYDGEWHSALQISLEWGVGDFNGDGRVDLLAYNRDTRRTKVYLSTVYATPDGVFRSVRGSRDLNAGIDLRRPVLTPTQEAELLEPWLEMIRTGEKGNYFPGIKRAYEEKLGRRVRDAVVYRMLYRQLHRERRKR